jgi:calcyphosin
MSWVIDCAFNKFVRDDADSVEAADLKAVFSGNLHPKVISGELSEDEVFLDFLTNFSDRNRDGRVHRDEWTAYYEKVCASIPNQAHFEQLMVQAWKL